MAKGKTGLLISKTSKEGVPLQIADIVGDRVFDVHLIEAAKIAAAARALKKPEEMKYVSELVDQIQEQFPGTSLEVATTGALYLRIRHESIPTARR